MDKNLCSSSPAPEPVPCEVPCSRDCVLSDWTPWSTCSQTCSSKTIEGKQLRTRSILAYNAGEGETPPADSLLHHRVWKYMQMRPGYWLSHGLSSRPLLSLTNVWISHLSACAFVLISNSLLICPADYFCWSVSSPDTHFLSVSKIISLHMLVLSGLNLVCLSFFLSCLQTFPSLSYLSVCFPHSHCNGCGVDHSDGG